MSFAKSLIARQKTANQKGGAIIPIIILIAFIVIGGLLVMAFMAALFGINDRCTKLQLAVWFFTTDHSRPPKCAMKGLDDLLAGSTSSSANTGASALTDSQTSTSFCKTENLEGKLKNAREYIDGGYFREAATKYLNGKEARLIALIATESVAFDRISYNKGSGAAGVAQFLYSTANGDSRYNPDFTSGGGRLYDLKNMSEAERATHTPKPGENFDVNIHDARFDPERSINAAAHKLSIDLKDKRATEAIKNNPGDDNEDGLFKWAYVEAYHTHKNDQQLQAALAGAKRMQEAYDQLIEKGSCQISTPQGDGAETVLTTGTQKDYSVAIPESQIIGRNVELFFDTAFGDRLVAAIKDARDFYDIDIKIVAGSESGGHSLAGNHPKGTAADINAFQDGKNICTQARPSPYSTSCNDTVKEIMANRGLQNKLCAVGDSPSNLPKGDCNHFSLTGR